LLTSLEVRFVAVTECLVSAVHMLQMGSSDAPGSLREKRGQWRAVTELRPRKPGARAVV